MDNSPGLTVDAIKANGRTASKMEKVFIATSREFKSQDCGQTARKLNGPIDIYLF